MREIGLKDPEILNIARERFLKYLVDGHRDTQEADVLVRLKKLGLTNWGPLFAVAELSLHVDMYPAEFIDSALLRMEKTVANFLANAQWSSLSYIDSRNSIIIIVFGDDMHRFADLDPLISKLIRRLMDDYGIVIYAGIGGVVRMATDIRHSAKEANTCIMYKNSAGRNYVINIKDIKQILTNVAGDNRTAFDRVVGCFMDGDLQKLNIRLNELMENLKISGANIQVIRQAYIELIAQIMRCVTDAGIKLSEEQTREQLRYVLSEFDPYAIKAWFLERCSDYIRQIGDRRQESTTHIAQIAKRYVERNYSEPSLSQQSVSDHIGLSVGYFGQLFFSQTGQRFVDYLHQYRMDVARNLLLTTNDKIKDISMAVGFGNVNYFNSLFRKYYGITPKEYRNQ